MKQSSSSALRDAVQVYQRQIRAVSLLDPVEERQLAERARQGDPASRDAMITRNLRLVMNLARRYENRGVPLMDLVSEGNIGLMRAVDKFDPGKGFRFSTYATWWVRQAIERAVMNQARTVRLPIHVLKSISSYTNTRRALEHEAGHPVPMHAVAEHMSMSPVQLNRLLACYEASQYAVSSTAEDDDMLALAMKQKGSEPSDGYSQHVTHTLLMQWLGNLEARHRSVISYRFGIYGDAPCTLEEVGRYVGLTRERVRQLQIEALALLRQMAAEQGIQAATLESGD